MSWATLLFSFSGRLSRARYWGLSLLLAAILVAGMVAAEALDMTPAWAALGVVIIVVLAAGLAVGVKRLHDRDKSGWWILLFYVTPLLLDGIAEWIEGWPVALLRLANLAISVWALIELGIRRGTLGPNRFGDNPLGERPVGAPAAR